MYVERERERDTYVYSCVYLYISIFMCGVLVLLEILKNRLANALIDSENGKPMKRQLGMIKVADGVGTPDPNPYKCCKLVSRI